MSTTSSPSLRSSSGAVHLVPTVFDPAAGIEPLPRPSTPLVGREETVSTVASLLGQEQVRLLTLTGPGGMGKTRIALEVASTSAERFPDGIVFVGLAPIIDSSLVIPTIAQSVGILGSGSRPLRDRLITSFDGKQMLIVLDNFEQVVDAAEEIAFLVAGSRTVTFLVTSRIPLHISNEREFAVPPLSLPHSLESSPVKLAKTPAIKLFIQRARAVKADFELDDANAAAVATICQRLGGLPLAIELAAARIKLLPPAAINGRLDLELLSGGPRDQPERLRTMRSAISWSYDLLQPSEQRLFRALSIFAGGCSLEAAEAIGAIVLSADSPSVIDTLSSLVNASLIWQEGDQDGEARFLMLEPIRQFGLEKLSHHGEQVEVHHLLIEWSQQVGARAAAAFKDRGPGPWGRRLAMEADNLRVSLGALESAGETESLLALLISLEPLWLALGYEREGHAWLTRALPHLSNPSSQIRIRAMTLASQLANAIGDVDAAIAFGQASLEAAEQAADGKGLADAHCTLGNIARGVGEDSLAQAHYEKALDRYRVLDDRYSVGYVLVQLAKLGNLGTIDHPGDPQDQALAESRCQEALSIFEALGNSAGVARALHQLGHLAYKRRDYTCAARFTRKALELRWADRNMTEVATSFEDLADICGMLGQARTAARFYGVAESLRETLGVPMWPSYRPEHDREVDHARQALPPDQFESARGTGRSLPIADAVAEALTVAKTIATSRARQRETATTPPTIHDVLTVREIEVMRLVAAGHSNREIADILFIGVPTVKSHIKKIMDKLHLDSRAAIVAYVHRHGLTSK